MRLTRRQLLIAASAAGAANAFQGSIRRDAVVARNSPRLTAPDFDAPMSVGNGEFCFTADFTGMQTFPELYEKTVPLCTQSQWGWHSFPIPEGLSPSQLRLEMFDTYGRQVGYKTNQRGQEKLFNYLRENPHRLNLARIGLTLDSKPVPFDVFKPIEQKLDLWNGELISKFELRGKPVEVRTKCAPDLDMLHISITSPLCRNGQLGVAIEFPYGSPNMNASDWSAPDRHTTVNLNSDVGLMELQHSLDDTEYQASLSGGPEVELRLTGKHRATIHTQESDSLIFGCEFRGAGSAPGPRWNWNQFWSTGGVIDLSGSTDPRAQELERRIVLSQYQTAIQCSGSMPPQETGLTCNSWFGKFHLEMHWWHAAHFPMWGRAPMLERSLPWYRAIQPRAREKAQQQGYEGVRWPKMTSPSGDDSPSGVGELLIWQQPHPILLAEACYLAHPNFETLKRHQEMVMQSAEFMASFAVEKDGRFMLGPPVIPAQENHPGRETWNPTFELAYWRQALDVAQTWRERLKLGHVAKWDDVRKRLAVPTVRDGVYLAHENCPQTYTERNRDHPSMLYAYGMLKGEGIDRETMRRTLRKVLDGWQWDDTWGWDFPAVAMTAARLGEPELAIDALFIKSPKNTWRANGHNWQRANLPLYLPGNGALLSAAAMMAGGWQGGPAGNAPGFPKKGWSVRQEGLKCNL